MTNKQLIEKLKAWMKKEGNSAAVLASALGYKSSATIHMWMQRGNVAHYKREDVIKIIS